MRLTTLVVALVLAIAVISTGSALGPPATPSPSGCTLEPLDIDDIEEAATGPVPRRAELVPSDELVTEDELSEVTAVVEMMTACANANLPLSSFAFATSLYIAEYFAGDAGQDQLGHLIAVASRSPDPAAPEDRLALISVESPVRYQDGRIGVTVVTANADAEFTDQLIFVETEDGWRLDQVILGESVEAEATPT